MSQRHLLRVLLATSALAAPAAYADCTKDTDCKGDRICERGACVSPSERSQPPPQPEYVAPPPPANPTPPPVRPAPRPRPVSPGSEQGWDGSRKNVVSYNLFSTVSGFLIAAGLQAQDPGLTIIGFTFLYERALLPNVSLFATLSPSFWNDPFGFIAYWGITVGGRYYLFGQAPSGFWLGGELGLLPYDLGPGLGMEGGYQWTLDSGLTLGVLGGVLFAPDKQNGGIQPGVGLGGLIGWNF